MRTNLSHRLTRGVTCLAILKWLALVAILLIGVAATLICLRIRREDAEYESSKHRISASEIQFDPLELNPNSMNGSYNLVGRVHNASASRTLTAVVLKVTLREALPSGAVEIVGEQETDIVTTIPPGQTREISRSLTFDGMPRPIGKIGWSYALTELRAE